MKLWSLGHDTFDDWQKLHRNRQWAIADLDQHQTLLALKVIWNPVNSQLTRIFCWDTLGSGWHAWSAVYISFLKFTKYHIATVNIADNNFFLKLHTQICKNKVYYDLSLSELKKMWLLFEKNFPPVADQSEMSDRAWLRDNLWLSHINHAPKLPHFSGTFCVAPRYLILERKFSIVSMFNSLGCAFKRARFTHGL